MKKLTVMLCVAAGVICIQSCDGGTTNNTADSVDSTQAVNNRSDLVDKDVSDFMTEAASGGMMEVQAGQMAQQKGQSQRVKDFGTMMIRDHSKANDELKQIAAQKNIAVPAALSEDHQKHLDELNKKSDKDFDDAYVSLMSKDHKEDIDKFTKASEKISDPVVRGFAKKTLPTLQMHLDSITAIKESIK